MITVEYAKGLTVDYTDGEYERLMKIKEGNKERRHRFTDQEVRDIRIAHSVGASVAVLARKYDCWPDRIRGIINRKYYNDVR